VRLCTSDAYVCLSVCDCALSIMVDSCRWLYLVVTFIEVKAMTDVSSLRAKPGLIQSSHYLKKEVPLVLSRFPFNQTLDEARNGSPHILMGTWHCFFKETKVSQQK
jgi:hypothetical protein